MEQSLYSVQEHNNGTKAAVSAGTQQWNRVCSLYSSTTMEQSLQSMQQHNNGTECVVSAAAQQWNTVCSLCSSTTIEQSHSLKQHNNGTKLVVYRSTIPPSPVTNKLIQCGNTCDQSPGLRTI